MLVFKGGFVFFRPFYSFSCGGWAVVGPLRTAKEQMPVSLEISPILVFDLRYFPLRLLHSGVSCTMRGFSV